MCDYTRNGPDRLFANGTVYTACATNPRASVLALRADRIVYAGHDRKEAAALLAPGFEETDLEGRAVVPGLMDSHLHLKMQGQRLSELDLHYKSRETVLRMVAEEAARLGPGRWIVGMGWNHELWAEQRWPSRDDLDAVAPRNPVALTRADSHSAWVNSPALEAAGFDRNSPEPRGGEILRKENGDLLGILVDTPMLKLWSVIPPMDDTQTRNAYARAQEELFRSGVTSVGDAWQTLEDHAALRSAYEAGVMKLRVYGMLGSVRHEGGTVFHDGLAPVSGLYGRRLSLRAFKAVLDGSLGSRSAWLSRDYADRPGHRGSGRYGRDELLDLVGPAARKGFQLCLHAIGDAAAGQALDVLEALGARPGARHRIEHFQTAGAEELDRAARLGVIAAMQTVHEKADKTMAEHRLDPVLLERSYPWRAVLERGGVIANGSDSPIEDGNPFLGFHAAVTRTPFTPFADRDPQSVRLTRREALNSYTAWTALAEFGEADKGTLEAGKLADFVVLDTDIMRCQEEAIPTTRVLMTVLGGETVYG